MAVTKATKVVLLSSWSIHPTHFSEFNTGKNRTHVITVIVSPPALPPQPHVHLSVWHQAAKLEARLTWDQHIFPSHELLWRVTISKVTDRQTGTSLICSKGVSAAIICINTKLLKRQLTHTHTVQTHLLRESESDLEGFRGCYTALFLFFPFTLKAPWSFHENKFFCV